MTRSTYLSSDKYSKYQLSLLGSCQSSLKCCNRIKYLLMQMNNLSFSLQYLVGSNPNRPMHLVHPVARNLGHCLRTGQTATDDSLFFCVLTSQQFSHPIAFLSLVFLSSLNPFSTQSIPSSAYILPLWSQLSEPS